MARARPARGALPGEGRSLLNVVAIVPEAVGEKGWGRLGEPAVLRSHFRRCAEPLREVLALPDSWLVWSLADRPAPRPLARGRIASSAMRGIRSCPTSRRARRWPSRTPPC